MEWRAIVQVGVGDYQERMRVVAKMRNPDAWYAYMEPRCGDRLDQRRAERGASGEEDAKEGAAGDNAKAQTRDSVRVFSKAGRQRRGRASDSS
jgi:hypothetical protein